MLDKLKVKQMAYASPPHPKIVVQQKVVSQPKIARNIIRPNAHNQMLRTILNNKPLSVAQPTQSVTIRRTQPVQPPPPPRPQIQEKIQKPVHRAVIRPFIAARPANSSQVIIKPSQVARLISATDQRIAALRDVGVGRILVIIAAGPSVNDVDFTKIKDNSLIDFMCINQPYQKLWPTKYWAFCDHTQYARNEAVWNDYNGIIINSYNVKARKHNQVIIKSRPGQGFSIDIIAGYHIGRSSTYAAMQVAYYMNYDKVYIFGVDMAAGKDGKLHYYGQNPDVTNENRMKRFEAEAMHYMWAAQHLPEEIRKKFVFCSSLNPWPFMSYFPKLDHMMAVEEVYKYTNVIMESRPKSQN